MRPAKAPPIWQESFTWNVPRICIHRGEDFGKEILWSQTFRNWKTWTRQKSTLEESMQKKSIDTTKGEDCIFPVADGTAKLSGRDHECREPAWRVGTTCEKWRSQWRTSRRTRRVLNRQKQKRTLKPGKTFGRSNVDFIDRHHIEPRVQLYVPKEETFPIPLKYIDVTGASYSHLNVLQEKRVDHWSVDANRSLSDSWKGITKFTLLKEKSPKVYMWSGWETNKKIKQLPDLSICGLNFGPENGKSRSEERKARVGKREATAR